MENPATEIRSSAIPTVTGVHCSRILIITLSVVSTVAAACYWSSFVYQDEHNNSSINIIQPLAASIKQACNTTLNPSHCFTQLTNTASSGRATSFHHLLEISLDQTISMVVTVHSRLSNLSNVHQELTSKNKNAFRDCLEMLELTLDELRQASDQVVEGLSYFHNLKTLLSAALTNENTCTDGFSESNQLRSRNQKILKDFIHSTLDPISTTISYCLAIITSMEGQDRYDKVKSLISKTADINKFPTWIESSDRNLIEGNAAELIPNVTVANDGTGDYRLISEAVRMAPNRSTRRYIIHIKRGVYNEVVGIPRDKANIMLVGDGMSSTVITGSRNVADGFTTFTSATLTVTGDKFLARDLTVVNTAGPRKRQAVAVRVTSNAAFYRCNFTSYQDTLYAHSLCQLYRECTIQGTIDFIFGNAAAVFQNCRILARKPILGQKNMITAQGRSDPNQNTGISIQNSVISAASGFTRTDMKYYPTFLGRPWRNFSRTIVMKSYLGHMIHPQGWCRWNQYSNLDTVQYIEYRNFGPGSNTTNRVRWGGYKNDSSDEMMKQFTVVEFLLGVDDWLDTTGFPLYQGT